MLQQDYSNISTVVLSYPEKFYNDYERLVFFYDELIELIPKEFKIVLIVNNKQSEKRLANMFQHKNLQVSYIKGWDEIWLRDCIGVNAKKHIIRPVYYPTYCKSAGNWDYYKSINELSNVITEITLQKETKTIELILDGGHLVCNNSKLFFTNKVYQQNYTHSKNEIDTLLKKITGLTPVAIENNKNDAIGHMDAYISFIDDKHAVIPRYPSSLYLKEDIEFVNKVEKILKENRIKPIIMYDRPVNEKVDCGCKRSCFYSARGNYINFLRLNNTIILPEYTLPTKKETLFYNNINQEILETLGFEVLRINCDMLAKFGGVLHCISFTI